MITYARNPSHTDSLKTNSSNAPERGAIAISKTHTQIKGKIKKAQCCFDKDIDDQTDAKEK